MANDISEFLNAIKEDLENNFPKLKVLTEDRGDIQFETENALSKQGLYVLLRISDYQCNGISDSKLAMELSSFIVQISEFVPVNRSSSNINNDTVYGISCQETSIEIAKFLYKKYNNILTLDNIHTDFIDGYFVSEIYFKTSVTIDI